MVRLHALVVVAAPAGMRDVLGVLADWSATGLIGSFLWTDTVPDPEQTTIRGLLVEDGLLSGCDIGRMVLDQSATIDEQRCCVLVPATSGVEALNPDVEAQLDRILSDAAGKAHKTRLRVIATDGALKIPAQEINHVGWHNLIVAPEESTQPGGHVALPTGVGLSGLTPLLASSVATLCGLWKDIPDSPLGALPISFSGDSRLFRPYVRFIDGTATQAQLEQAVLMPPVGNPRPSSTKPGTRPTYISDEESCIADFANRWWKAHEEHFRGGAERVRLDEQRRIGKLDAIKRFFTFLASMFNPAAWLRSWLHSVDEGINQYIQQSLYGSDSRFVVSSKGNLQQRLDNLDDLDQRVPAAHKTQFEATPAFPELWKDFSYTAMTLLDAGERGVTAEPAAVSGQPGVLRDVAPCAPDEYFLVNTTLGLPPALQKIAPADAFEKADLVAILTEMAANGNSPLAAQELERERAWQDKIDKSFTAQIGTRFYQQSNSLIFGISQCLKALEANSELDQKRFDITLKKTRTRLIVLLLIALLLLAAGAIIGALAIIAWPVAATIMGAVFLGWLASSFAAFYSGMKPVFQEIERRRHIIPAQQVLTANLRADSRALRNTLVAYQQFKRWARIVTEFVNRPFGVSADGLNTSGQLIGGFPANVQIRELVLPEAEQNRVAAELDHSFHTVGWLSDPWDAVVSDVKNRLGPKAASQLDAPSDIFADPGTDDLPLALWSDLVMRDGIGHAPTTAATRKVDTYLDAGIEPWHVMRQARLIDVTGDSREAEGFIDAIVNAEPGSAFDSRVLTTQGRVRAGVTVPDTLWHRDSSHCLSRMAVRVEIGQGIAAEYLASEARPAKAVDETNDSDDSESLW